MWILQAVTGILSILLEIGLVTSQNANSQLFVKFSTEPINIDANTEKVYKTTLQVNSTMQLNETEFWLLVRTFYRENTSLRGFVGLSNGSVSNNSNIYTINYNVTYNYIELLASANGTDAVIESTIGNASYVKNGIESVPSFIDSFSIITNGFQFQGFDVCINGNCNPGIYVTCTETEKGITITCRSICEDNYCLNDGDCIHDDPNTLPLCSCVSSTDTWYVGDRCAARFQLWMPIVFFIVLGLILLVAIPLITCYCIKTIEKRIEKEKQKQIKKAMAKQNKAKKVAENNAKPTAKAEDKVYLTTVSNSNSIHDKTSLQNDPTPTPRRRVTASNRAFQRQESATSESSSSQVSEGRFSSESDQISSTENSVVNNEVQYQSDPMEASNAVQVSERTFTSDTSSSTASLPNNSNILNKSHQHPTNRSVSPPPYTEPLYAVVDKKKSQTEGPLISTV